MNDKFCKKNYIVLFGLLVILTQVTVPATGRSKVMNNLLLAVKEMTSFFFYRRSTFFHALVSLGNEIVASS